MYSKHPTIRNAEHSGLWGVVNNGSQHALLSADHKGIQMQKDLTNGNLFGKMMQFAVPYLIACFLQTFYGNILPYVNAFDVCFGIPILLLLRDKGNTTTFA